MDKNILTILVIVFMSVGCGKNRHSNDMKITSVAIEEKHFDVYKCNTELREISIFFVSSSGISEVGFSSNSIIDMVKTGKGIDTLKITDKNNKLFTQLQKLLKTAIIDSTSFIGRPDTIIKYEQVKNVAGLGFVIKREDTGKVDTVAINTYRYNKLQNGKYCDVKPGKTFMFLYYPDENDIAADWMILYQYRDSSIANDTLCCDQFFAPTVRLNSYVATMDSLLLEMVVDSLRKKITYLKTEILLENNWEHFINNRTNFRRYVKNNEIILYKDSCLNSEILLRTNDFNEGKLFSHKGNWRRVMLRDYEGKEIYGWIYPTDK